VSTAGSHASLRSASSLKKSIPSLLMAPIVSAAIVTNERDNSNLGRRIAQSTKRERLPLSATIRLIQRYNAVAVLGTFAHTTPEDEM